MDANETLVMLLAAGASAFYAGMVYVSARRRKAQAASRAQASAQRAGSGDRATRAGSAPAD